MYSNIIYIFVIHRTQAFERSEPTVVSPRLGSTPDHQSNSAWIYFLWPIYSPRDSYAIIWLQTAQ